MVYNTFFYDGNRHAVEGYVPSAKAIRLLEIYHVIT